MTIQFRLGGKLIIVTNAPQRGNGGDLRKQKLPKSEIKKLRGLLGSELGDRADDLSDTEVVEQVARRVAEGRWTQTLVNAAPLLGSSSPAKVAEPEAAGAGAQRVVDDSKKKTWVEVELLDYSCRPVKGAKVEITLPDGSTTRTTLGGDGTVKINGIDSGTCKVTFPDIDGREWKRSGDIPSGEAVELFAGPPKIPSGSYTVKQGDYLASITEEAGFLSWKTLWDDGANASIKAKRNPNVLYPGDVVTVPIRQRKEESVATGEKTTFETIGDPLTVKLVVLSWDGTPISTTDVQFKLDSTEAVKTAEDGSAKKNIKATGPKEGDLTVQTYSMPLKLGHLDPAEEFSGQVWRLNNLGYRAGEPANADDLAFRSAVEEFQCDNGIAVTGRCDTATQDKLRTVHGS